MKILISGQTLPGRHVRISKYTRTVRSEEIDLERMGYMGGRALRVALGEKMDNSIYFRGITDLADFHFQVEQLLKVVHVDGQGRAIGKVIYQGVYFAEIYCRGEYFFHYLWANKYADHGCKTYVSAVDQVPSWVTHLKSSQQLRPPRKFFNYDGQPHSAEATGFFFWYVGQLYRHFFRK